MADSEDEVCQGRRPAPLSGAGLAGRVLAKRPRNGFWGWGEEEEAAFEKRGTLERTYDLRGKEGGKRGSKSLPSPSCSFFTLLFSFLLFCELAASFSP